MAIKLKISELRSYIKEAIQEYATVEETATSEKHWAEHTVDETPVVEKEWDKASIEEMIGKMVAEALLEGKPKKKGLPPWLKKNDKDKKGVKETPETKKPEPKAKKG